MFSDVQAEILVSVICLAYNHEKFIAKTLEGFVSQQTNFRFEVFVHDDASTDNTAAIIQKYAEEYPDIFRPIFEKENQYKKSIKIIKTFILPKMSGKYVAWCEGDDFWIDTSKLQRQVDALEYNSNCVACFTKVQQISYEGKPLSAFFPRENLKEGVINNSEYSKYTLREGFPWQLSGFMIRREIYNEYNLEEPEYRKYFEVGDLPIFLYLIVRGDIYYIDKVMSYYRTNNPESWIGRTNKDDLEKSKYYQRKANAYKQFDIYSEKKYHAYASIAIKYSLFSAYLRLNDLKKIKSLEMRSVYSKLTVKQKIYIHLNYYLPVVIKIYNLIKKR